MQEIPLKKIMIVDDAGYIRILFKEALKSSSYRIVTCDNIAAAYELIKFEPPDLLLLDINMPGGSGIDLLKQLRIEGFSFPVIMITALSSRESVLDASQYNIFAYLSKPVDVNKLRARVQEALFPQKE